MKRHMGQCKVAAIFGPVMTDHTTAILAGVIFVSDGMALSRG